MSLQSKGVKVGLTDLLVKRTSLSSCEALDSEGNLAKETCRSLHTLKHCASCFGTMANEEIPNPLRRRGGTEQRGREAPGGLDSANEDP